MHRLLPNPSSLFLPDDEALSPEAKDRVRFHRLLTLLGAALAALSGLLYGGSSPGALDPRGPFLLIGTLLAGLLAASYVSGRVRRQYVEWTRGLLCALMGWAAVGVALKGFTEGYAAGLLFTYAVLTATVGAGGRSLRPLLWFGGFGLFVTAGGAALVPAPDGRPLFLLGCMAAAGFVEGLAVQGLSSTRKRLRKQEGRLPSIIENVSAGLFRAAPGEGIVYANRAVAEIFGYGSDEELLRTDPADLYVNPEQRKRLWAEAKRKGGFDATEVKLRRKDGSAFTGLLSGKVAYDEDGEVKYYDGAVTDLTERKQAEQTLREEIDRLETLFECLPTPVAFGRLEENGRIRVQSTNEAFEKTFGWTTAAGEEETCELLVLSDGEAESAESPSRPPTGGSQVEVRQETADGPQVFQPRLVRRKREDGPPEVYLIYTDVTREDRSQEELRQVQRASISRLARAAEAQDYGTDGHIRRVGTLARLLAEALGQPPEWQERIEEAAPFHDVGKVCIADRILRKPGPLSGEERKTMKEHTSIGPDLLCGGDSALIRMARRIARFHHERWDGEGYPDGLEGEEIPLSARIVAVADAFDAMTHERPYREALSKETAFSIIEEEAGAQFDPRISEAALQIREAMYAVEADGEEALASDVVSVRAMPS